MNTAALSRDPFMPQQPKGRGMALVLALLAHVLLILALAFGVNWGSEEPATVAAELWSATPQAAAPRAVEPPPTAPPEVKKAAPVVKPAPEPAPTPKPTPALPDPQIAIEKAKREEAKRVADEQAQQQKREKAARDKEAREDAERDKRAKDEQAQKKADKEKADKAEAAKQEAIRTANLKRIAGMAGATGGATDTGNALRSSAPSANYGGLIYARIYPNIVLTDTIEGNPAAVVDVRLAPDGTIISRRILKSSGVQVWDDAVLRAIDRTGTLPRDVDGRVPPQVVITFKPQQRI